MAGLAVQLHRTYSCSCPSAYLRLRALLNMKPHEETLCMSCMRMCQARVKIGDGLGICLVYVSRCVHDISAGRARSVTEHSSSHLTRHHTIRSNLVYSHAVRRFESRNHSVAKPPPRGVEGNNRSEQAEEPVPCRSSFLHPCLSRPCAHMSGRPRHCPSGMPPCPKRV